MTLVKPTQVRAVISLVLDVSVGYGNCFISLIESQSLFHAQTKQIKVSNKAETLFMQLKSQFGGWDCVVLSAENNHLEDFIEN